MIITRARAGDCKPEAEAEVRRGRRRVRHRERRALADLGVDRSWRRRLAVARLDLRDLGVLARDGRVAGIRELAPEPAPADHRGDDRARDPAAPAPVAPEHLFAR